MGRKAEQPYDICSREAEELDDLRTGKFSVNIREECFMAARKTAETKKEDLTLELAFSQLDTMLEGWKAGKSRWKSLLPCISREWSFLRFAMKR